MKKFLRILSLALSIVLVILVIVSCDKGESGTEKGDENVVSTSEKKEFKKDFNGRAFTVLGRDGSNLSIGQNFEIARDKCPDDAVGSAVWERNEKLKADYNFTVEQVIVSNTANAAQNEYLAESGKYDVVIYHPKDAFLHANDAYLTDLYDLENIF